MEDTSWCPVCDKLILPRRYLVPINNTSSTTVANTTNDDVLSPSPIQQHQHPSTPPVPPSSPAIAPLPPPTTTTTHLQRTRSKQRAPPHGYGGLAHGTGRIRPGLGRTRSQRGKVQQVQKQVQPVQQLQQQQQVVVQQQQQQQQQPQEQKMRTVIDQRPTPLYCSEECELADTRRNRNGATNGNGNGNTSGYFSDDHVQIRKLSLMHVQNQNQNQNQNRNKSSTQSLSSSPHPNAYSTPHPHLHLQQRKYTFTPHPSHLNPATRSPPTPSPPLTTGTGEGVCLSPVVPPVPHNSWVLPIGIGGGEGFEESDTSSDSVGGSVSVSVGGSVSSASAGGSRERERMQERIHEHEHEHEHKRKPERKEYHHNDSIHTQTENTHTLTLADIIRQLPISELSADAPVMSVPALVGQDFGGGERVRVRGDVRGSGSGSGSGAGLSGKKDVDNETKTSYTSIVGRAWEGMWSDSNVDTNVDGNELLRTMSNPVIMRTDTQSQSQSQSQWEMNMKLKSKSKSPPPASNNSTRGNRNRNRTSLTHTRTHTHTHIPPPTQTQTQMQMPVALPPIAPSNIPSVSKLSKSITDTEMATGIAAGTGTGIPLGLAPGLTRRTYSLTALPTLGTSYESGTGRFFPMSGFSRGDDASVGGGAVDVDVPGSASASKLAVGYGERVEGSDDIAHIARSSTLGSINTNTNTNSNSNTDKNNFPTHRQRQKQIYDGAHAHAHVLPPGIESKIIVPGVLVGLTRVRDRDQRESERGSKMKTKTKTMQTQMRSLSYSALDEREGGRYQSFANGYQNDVSIREREKMRRFSIYSSYSGSASGSATGSGGEEVDVLEEDRSVVVNAQSNLQSLNGNANVKEKEREREKKRRGSTGTGTGTGTGSVKSFGTRNGSVLGSVREDEDDAAEERGSERGSVNEMSIEERRRMCMETTNWTYASNNTLTYDAFPRPKIVRRGTERIFIPDSTPSPSASPSPQYANLSTSLPTPSVTLQPIPLHKSPHAINVTQHTKTRSSGVAPRDEILEREEREMRRWRGEWRAGLPGRVGWWVEIEVVEVVRAERKRLFVWV